MYSKQETQTFVLACKKSEKSRIKMICTAALYSSAFLADLKKPRQRQARLMPRKKALKRERLRN